MWWGACGAPFDRIDVCNSCHFNAYWQRCKGEMVRSPGKRKWQSKQRIELVDAIFHPIPLLRASPSPHLINVPCYFFFCCRRPGHTHSRFLTHACLHNFQQRLNRQQSGASSKKKRDFIFVPSYQPASPNTTPNLFRKPLTNGTFLFVFKLCKKHIRSSF